MDTNKEQGMWAVIVDRGDYEVHHGLMASAEEADRLAAALQRTTSSDVLIRFQPILDWYSTTSALLNAEARLSLPDYYATWIRVDRTLNNGAAVLINYRGKVYVATPYRFGAWGRDEWEATGYAMAETFPYAWDATPYEAVEYIMEQLIAASGQ